MVRILILIYEHVVETSAVVHGHIRVLTEDPHHFPDEVVEVERVRTTQPLLVKTVDLAENLVFLHRIVDTDELILPSGNTVSQYAGAELLDVQLHVLGDLLQQALGIV